LYRAYYRPLLLFVLPLVGAAAVAEEIVEDVFVHVWEHRTSLDVRHSVNTYLFTAVRNRALNVARRERVEQRWRESVVDTREVVSRQSHESPEAVVDAERVRVLVQAAVETLSEQRKLVLTLRWQHGMSYAEIAEVVGSSVVAVERQLSRTLKALRLALPEWLSADDLA
jgi:RNA polymerase sigma-70 factor (ECF subfamily)